MGGRLLMQPDVRYPRGGNEIAVSREKTRFQTRFHAEKLGFTRKNTKYQGFSREIAMFLWKREVLREIAIFIVFFAFFRVKSRFFRVKSCFFA